MFSHFVRYPLALTTALLFGGLLTGCVADAPVPSGSPATQSGPSFGVPAAAIVAGAEMSDLGEKLVVVMFQPAKVTAADLASAPAIICDSRKRGLVSSEIKDLEHPGDLPGVRKLVVRCK